jgi:hypothetical protein
MALQLFQPARYLGDPVHVPFTHRESRSRIGVDVVVPDQLVAEENDVGIKLTRLREDTKRLDI